jgi:hypothetical protein
MTKRSAVLIATVVIATGAIIGRSWVAGDERGSAKRQATTVGGAETPMTAAKAARLAGLLVKSYRAPGCGQWCAPVLHCKLATPRQRYLCADARPLTAASLTAEILARPPAPARGPRCVVQSENGDLWTIASADDRCW